MVVTKNKAKQYCKLSIPIIAYQADKEMTIHKLFTPQREYIYVWETGYFDEGFYGKGNFDSVDDYKRRKWSRIRKVKHRNKKAVNKEIKYEIK